MKDLSKLDSRRRGFEVTDGNPRAIFLVAIALLVALVASMIGIALIYRNHFTAKSAPMAADFRGGAGQRTSIEESWRSLDAENTLHLDGYRWIDKSRGIVQIPIKKAMELLAEKEQQP